MTKYKRKTIQRSVGRMVTTKSWFGSHEEMVVDPCDAEELEPNVRWAVLKEGQVVCKDDEGYYITYKDRLDNGLADRYRYSAKYRL